MLPRIGIQQAADHPLVLCAVLCCLPLEEIDAALRQCDRHFYAFLAKSKFFRGRQKIRNDLQVAQRFIGVSCFLGHKFVDPFASIRHQRFE